MPREIASRELGFAAGLGFNTVRMWLSAWDFESNPSAFEANLHFLFDEAARLSIGVVPILLDSCGVEPEEGEVSAKPLSEAVAGWQDSPALQAIKSHFTADERVDLFDAPTMVEVADRGDPAAVIWEWWSPNPGYHWLGEEHWTCIRAQSWKQSSTIPR